MRGTNNKWNFFGRIFHRGTLLREMILASLQPPLLATVRFLWLTSVPRFHRDSAEFQSCLVQIRFSGFYCLQWISAISNEAIEGPIRYQAGLRDCGDCGDCSGRFGLDVSVWKSFPKTRRFFQRLKHEKAKTLQVIRPLSLGVGASLAMGGMSWALEMGMYRAEISCDFSVFFQPASRNTSEIHWKKKTYLLHEIFPQVLWCDQLFGAPKRWVGALRDRTLSAKINDWELIGRPSCGATCVLAGEKPRFGQRKNEEKRCSPGAEDVYSQTHYVARLARLLEILRLHSLWHAGTAMAALMMTPGLNLHWADESMLMF